MVSTRSYHHPATIQTHADAQNGDRVKEPKKHHRHTHCNAILDCVPESTPLALLTLPEKAMP